jgi:cysteine sulfinate desulfinase/cysteine desulfurase-like protein
VLEAIGLSQDAGMARLSFAHDTTLEEVTKATAIMADVIDGLRKAP